MARRLTLPAALLLLAVRTAGAGPNDLSDVVEVRWPKGSSEAGVIAGVTKAKGEPVATLLEVRRLIDYETARKGMTDVGSLLRAQLSTADPAKRPDLTLSTGVSGRYRIRGLPPGAYSVRAPRISARGLEATTVLPDDRSGCRVDLDAVPGTQVLKGKFVGRDGKSRSGVLAIGFARGGHRLGDQRGLPPIQVGPDGAFSVDGLPAGPVSVEVRDPADDSFRKLGVTLPFAGDLIVELGPVATMKGRVLDAEGAAVSNASLRVLQVSVAEEPEEQGLEFAEWKTKADGSFEWPCPFRARSLSAAAPGRGMARIELFDPELFERQRKWQEKSARDLRGGDDDEVAVDDATREWIDERHPKPPQMTDPLMLRLEKPARIKGTVKDGEKGVAGVHVVAFSIDGLGMGLRAEALLEMRMAFGMSRRDGTYEIEDVRPGSYLVAAAGNGWCSTTVLGLELDGTLGLSLPKGVKIEPGEVVSADLVVVPTARVEGKVIGIDGRPAADAPVEVVMDGAEGPLTGLKLLSSADAASRVLTSPTGTYVIDTVPSDVPIRVAATGASGDLAFGGSIAVTGRGAKRVDLTLEKPGRIDLRVVIEGSQKPAAGVRMSVDRGKDAVVAHPAIATQVFTTDGDGRATLFPVPREGGEFEVFDLARWVNVNFVVDPFAPGEMRRTMVVHLPAPGTVAGKLFILGPPGAPLKNTHFEFEDPTEVDPSRYRLDFDHEIRTRRVESDGSFSVESAKGGEIRVVATLPWQGEWYEASQTITAPASGVTLRLAPVKPGRDDPRVLVRVRDPEGKPIPAARFEVFAVHPQFPGLESRPGGHRPHDIRSGVGITSDPGELFKADRRSEAQYWISVWRPRDGKTALPLGAVRVGPFPAGGGVREVTLPRERKAVVRVIGPDGKGVAGASVWVRFAPRAAPEKRTPNPYPTSLEVATERTSPDGDVTIARLGPAAFEYSVRPPDGYVTPAPQVSDRASLEFRLVAERVATVTVVDGEGAPVERAEVRIYTHLPAEPDEPEVADDGSPESRRKKRASDERKSRRQFRIGEDSLFSGTTDAKGQVAVKGLDPTGRYDLVLSPGFRRDDLKRTEVSDWKVADLRMVMGPNEKGSRLRVRTKDGSPAAQFMLWSYSIGKWREEKHPSRRPDGTLFVGDSFEKEHLFVATRPGRAPPVSPPAIQRWIERARARRASADGTLDIAIDEGISMTIEIRGAEESASISTTALPDPREVPISRLVASGIGILALLEEKPLPSPIKSARGGVVTIPNLNEMERYVVHATTADGMAGVLRGVLAGPGPLRIQLSPVVELTGRVTPALEEGEEGVVEYAEPGLFPFGVPIEPDGSFSLGGLPAGRYRLHAIVRMNREVVRERVFTAQGPAVGNIALREGSLEAALGQAFGWKSQEGPARTALLDTILKIDPADPHAGPARARARHEAGDEVGARSDVDRVLEVWPKNSDALETRSDLRWRGGDHEGSIADGEQALELGDSASRRYDVAWRCESLGLLEKAEAHAVRALALSPDLGLARGLQAEIARQTKSPEAALTDAEEALLKFPGEAAVQVAWARAKRRVGKSADILPKLDAWINESEKSDSYFTEPLRFERTLAWIETGDLTTAEGDLAHYVDDDNGWYEAWLWFVRARLGKAKEAVDRVKKRLESTPRGTLDDSAQRMLEYLVGTKSEADVTAVLERGTDDAIGRASSARLRTQAWFFIAEKRRSEGDLAGAAKAYEAAISTRAEKEAEFTLAVNSLRDIPR